LFEQIFFFKLGLKIEEGQRLQDTHFCCSLLFLKKIDYKNNRVEQIYLLILLLLNTELSKKLKTKHYESTD